ncbi:hypothetical protein LDENG_00262110 [Lucifuga dentata]|nr:hypothetical protein LDENG_00262110 [Lucifuga dentata]
MIVSNVTCMNIDYIRLKHTKWPVWSFKETSEKSAVERKCTLVTNVQKVSVLQRNPTVLSSVENISLTSLSLQHVKLRIPYMEYFSAIYQEHHLLI